MGNLREEFEKLPEIADRIKRHEMGFCNKGNMYYSHGGSYISVAYVNGAWFAFQEQQKKLDAVKSKLSNIYDACDDNTTVALLLDEIQGLLK